MAVKATLKSTRVSDYMSATLVTFMPETEILDAVRALVKHRIAGAPVVDHKGNIVGMLSEFDCLRVALTAGYHGEPGGPVSDFMSGNTQTVDADMSIIELAMRFLESGFRRYPVVKDNRLVGQISRRDVLRALSGLASR